MNDTEKELRRIRFEDLDTSLQNRLLSMVQKDDENWIKISDTINDTYERTNIEEKLVTVTITNQDPDNQTVKIIVDDTTYTSGSFTCWSTSSYRIIITPLAFLKAGECNVALSGYFRDDTEVIVGKTSSIIADKDEEDNSPTYTIKVKVGVQYLSGYNQVGMICSYLWAGYANYDTKLAECDPTDIIDQFTVTNSNNTQFTSIYAFYGAVPVYDLFNTFTSYMVTPNGTRYTIAENLPSSDFNNYGDLHNLPSMATKSMYDLLFSLVGEWITIEIYLK